MNNKLKSSIIEFHIIQSFPVSCLNRDDLGSPKTAIVGGVTRARVSSQSWKRAIRLKLQEMGGVELGVRTKKVDVLLFDEMIKRGVEEEKAQICAQVVSDKIAKDTLVFISDKEVVALVDYLESTGFEVDASDAGDAKDGAKAAKGKKTDLEKEIAKILTDISGTGLSAVDIALFGRMVAKINAINVDAACSFSHAISTHAIENDVDFFSALDDFGGDESGAAHIGNTEFNSATYYRYISLNLGQLAENIFGDAEVDVEQIKAILEPFIKALYCAVPGARQATQAAFMPWDFASVLVRQGQPMQISFEKPVRGAKTTGLSEPSIDNLKAKINSHQKISGDLYGLKACFEIGGEDSMSLADLIANVQNEVGKVYE